MVEKLLNYYKKYLIYGYRILLKKERIFLCYIYGYKPRFSTFLIKNIMIYMKINYAHNLYRLLWLKFSYMLIKFWDNYVLNLVGLKN